MTNWLRLCPVYSYVKLWPIIASDNNSIGYICSCDIFIRWTSFDFNRDKLGMISAYSIYHSLKLEAVSASSWSDKIPTQLLSILFITALITHREKLLDSDWLSDYDFIRNLRANSVIWGKLQIWREKICNSLWTQIRKRINDQQLMTTNQRLTINNDY